MRLIATRSTSSHEPRIWDAYLHDGKSTRVWTERKTDSIDGWFALEDIPALHRLDELVPIALAERGLTPGTVGVKAHFNCDHFDGGDWRDEESFTDDSAQHEIPQCPVTIRIHFDHDREDYEGVTFDAEGELRR